MLQGIAFSGTGPCDPADLRNAAIGRFLIILAALLLIAFVIKKFVVQGKNTWVKALGGGLSVVIALAAAAGIFIINVGVACSGGY